MTGDTPILPARDADGHKGTFGTVCVVGGQCVGPRVMIGGPALTAMGALRSGAGLAVLAVPAPLITAALTIAPSATGLALPVDDTGRLRPSEVAGILDETITAPRRCLAIGPGLGSGTDVQQVVVRLCAQESVPLVLDADALNALAALRDFAGDLKAPAVLTPHPGEFARLARGLDLPDDATDPARRPVVAEMLARRLGAVVVLKGAGTIVTDGLRTTVNPTGNAALATAGTGDVLTGVIAGLVAQFVGRDDTTGLLECAELGVWLHGRAADRWAERHGPAGLLAADLLAEIPGALAEIRAPGEPASAPG